MTGPFNTIRRESEGHSHEASSHLMEALARLFEMLRELERRDDAVHDRRGECVELLHKAEALFVEMIDILSDEPLALAVDDPDRAELDTLYAELRTFGVGTPIRNFTLAHLAAIEVGRLRSVIENTPMHLDERDWFTFNEIVHALNRTLRIGMILSRIAALTPRGKRL